MKSVHDNILIELTVRTYIIVLRFASAAWINLATGGGGWELRMKYKYIRRSGKMNSSPVTAMAEVVGVQHGCTYLIKIPGNLKIVVTD